MRDGLKGEWAQRVPRACCGSMGHSKVLLASGRFTVQADDLRLYRHIATMDASAPPPSLRAQRPTWAKASDLAREWDLNRLADRLAEVAIRAAGQSG
jgi:hypothetical protein